jgi:uncharacterized protein (PEP-CTERM system associated)
MFSAESTFTNNVDLLPNGERRSDWVNQLTPGVRFDERGARTKLTGEVSVPVLLYARTSENNYVAPQADVSGTLEAVERLFFVDARALVSQQYRNPLGARSQSLANATDNRYTAQSYTLSPYFKGEALQGVDYELRHTSLWSDANLSSLPGRSYTDGFSGHVTRTPAPFGWSAAFDRSHVKFEDEQSEVIQIGRVSAGYRPESTFQMQIIGGYEDNRFFDAHERGATYGFSTQWRPTPRTRLDAMWEHRFFGSSYSLSFDHRTPLSVWSISAQRDITTYPQQLANFAQGSNVSALLNGLFVSRVQDPLERQALVDRFIRERGLPTQLASALAIFTQRVTLVEAENATFGLLGARNAVLFHLYRTRNEAVETGDAALSPLVDLFTNVTQVGGSAVWAHRLTPTANLDTTLTWSRNKQNAIDERTTLYSLETRLSRTVTTLTTVYAGARYQNSRSDAVGFDFNEFAVFVGLNYTFH